MVSVHAWGARGRRFESAHDLFWVRATLTCSMTTTGFRPSPTRSPTRRQAAPNWAARIVDLLSKADIASRIDAERGYDHGLFIPLKLMYPEAVIPVPADLTRAGSGFRRAMSPSAQRCAAS